jgi:hypothetical protein
LNTVSQDFERLVVKPRQAKQAADADEKRWKNFRGPIDARAKLRKAAEKVMATGLVNGLPFAPLTMPLKLMRRGTVVEIDAFWAKLLRAMPRNRIKSRG